MKKIISAILLSLAAIALVLYLPAFLFKIIVLVLLVASLVEYTRLAFSKKKQQMPTIIIGVLVAAAFVFVWPESSFLSVVLLVGVFALAMSFMYQAKKIEGIFNSLAFACFPLFYLVLGLSMWTWLRDLPQGQTWVLLTLAGSCLSDSAAFIFGKSIGKRKFAPLISPNKTMEGFGGALLGSLLGVFLVHFLFLKDVAWLHLVILAVLIWLLSAMGDLIESLIKRGLDVKDSGDLIPGHGGLLDRLDALVFTGPVVFVYVKYVLTP